MITLNGDILSSSKTQRLKIQNGRYLAINFNNETYKVFKSQKSLRKWDMEHLNSRIYIISDCFADRFTATQVSWYSYIKHPAYFEVALGDLTGRILI